MTHTEIDLALRKALDDQNDALDRLDLAGSTACSKRIDELLEQRYAIPQPRTSAE